MYDHTQIFSEAGSQVRFGLLALILGDEIPGESVSLSYTEADYAELLRALTPVGAAWSVDAGSTRRALYEAFAVEMARVDARGADALAEGDPRLTAELLADWERVAGLPDGCVQAAQGVQERRAALVAKLTMRGGQRRSYYMTLADALGYDITITEFPPFVAGGAAGDLVTNGDWAHAWQVNASATEIRPFQVGRGVAGDALASWGSELLECVIRRLKPAQSTLLFAYS